MDKLDLSNLSLFTGTEQYYRLSPVAVLTDGTKYLAEAAGAYWLMDAVSSYLPQFMGREDFVVAKLNVKAARGELTLDNGNGRILDRQIIHYTDFPLAAITLYASWAGEFWVLMLPSEY